MSMPLLNPGYMRVTMVWIARIIVPAGIEQFIDIDINGLR
jgi:hypothetical protein